MRDLDYLKLLSHEFPNANSCAAEIINLSAILNLPKGNEYFFSDIHGEYMSFIHFLRSASGVIRTKVHDLFGNMLTQSEQLALANLIYYPSKVLADKKVSGELDDEWYRITIHRLIAICREACSKYTRSKVRKKLPKYFDYAIDELLFINENEQNKKLYYQEFITTIIQTHVVDEFIIALSELIQNLLVDMLHIIGDIFDRGPRADYVMDELAAFHDVDIQWGNHDISWMGAAAGNTTCIATVLRIASSYNSFDVLEDGYGINLRPLSMFAADVYKDDACDAFRPHLLYHNKYDAVEEDLSAKMCKAMTVIELKLEGQLIKRHPEYHLEHRLFLDKINYETGTITIGSKTYALKDSSFPTVDPKDPYRLTEDELILVNSLRYSFLHSTRLHKHIRFLYSHGSMYKIYNNNLMFHGCIPMDENGEFTVCTTPDGDLSGKELMDYLEKQIIDAYFLNAAEEPEKKRNALDLMWYLWAGPNSPLFGKDKMTTFEQIFIGDKELCKEHYNPYYDFSKDAKYCDKIFHAFGMNSKRAHIINGHVPVKVVEGEHPVKANGKLYIIDGGLSKAYHSKTGICGYTLIFNSHHLALAEHKEYIPGGENTPTIHVTEVMDQRLLVKDTDTGMQIQQQIDDLKELLECYKIGSIKERY